MTTADVLQQLLALTPAVPPDDADGERLIAALEDLLPERQRVLEQLAACDRRLTPAEQLVVEDIRAREAAWHEVLQRCLQRLGDTRANLGKVRRYAADL